MGFLGNLSKSAFGVPGLLWGLSSASKEAKSKSEIGSAKSALEESLALQKLYETPEEALKIQELSEASASQLRSIADIGQEAVDIAEFQAGLSEAPGAIQAREDIRASSATATQNIVEAGGGGAAALGAIADVNRGQMEQLRQLSASNQQYRSQALQNLQSSLMGQAQLEASVESAALGAENYGLQTMIGEKGKEYQSYLDKLRLQQQYDITQLGNLYAEREAEKNRESQLWSDIIGGFSGLATSLI